MKASVYDERSDMVITYPSVEKALEIMGAAISVEQNDPMNTNEHTYELVCVEDDCAYFNKY